MIYQRGGFNQYFSISGIFDFFHQLFDDSTRVSKIIILAFFSIFLIVPLLGGPDISTAGQLESVSVFSGLTIVFSLMIMVVYMFAKRQSDPRLKKAGSVIILMISIPILLYLLTIVLTFLWGLEVIVVLRATSSVVIIIPLLLIVIMLVESVIRQGIVKKGSKVSLGLVFLTIVLIMYTFATVYYVNGLLTRTATAGGIPSTDVINISFADSMYYSGEIFTTLGSSEIVPIGIGQWVTLFESITGYMVLGFLTAIFIQTIIATRGNL